ncbi:hypothetical protein BDV93DRAFT_527513 [Ceratobasidium sp. AG-I]|nr:hypothetical protein BDV93DRAFT_527513 [Ceratobasidium sp. AG-I]
MSGVAVYDWGPPLEEYLKACTEFPKPPASVEQAKAALLALSGRPNSSNLRDFDGISCSTLEDIMSFMYYPAEVGSLYAPISLQCFSLLKIYTKHNKLFERAFGYLLLQVLTAATMVNMMIHNDRFDSVMNRLDMAGRMTNTRSPTLLMTFVHGIAKVKLNGADGLGGLLDWRVNPLSSVKQDLCQIGIGGVSLVDARFLLKHLHSERSMFLIALASKITRGWIYLLHIIWGHLIRLPQKEKSTTSMLSQLRDLIFRCSISTDTPEQILMVHFSDMTNRISIPQPSYPVGVDDVQMIIDIVVQRISPTSNTLLLSPLPLDFVTDLLDYTFMCLSKQKMHESYSVIFKAAFSRLWYDLTKLPARDVRWLNVAPFAFRLLGIVVDLIELISLPKMPQNKPVSMALSVLAEIDLVNLLGRLILLPTLLKVLPRNLGTDMMVFEGATSWIGLKPVTELSESLASYSPLVRHAFADSRPDWLKTRRHIYALFIVCPPGSNLHGHLWQCAIAWRDFGAALGYAEPILRVTCAYPRCDASSEPRWACGLCLEDSYCSRQCHQKDWQLSSSSHKSKCSAYNEVRSS